MAAKSLQATRGAAVNLRPGRPRPAILRALGDRDLPPAIYIDCRRFRHESTFKHDSWAATAVYRCGEERIVCKFNRQHSIFGVPMFWLGWWLARREAKMLDALADLPNVPDGCGPVMLDACVLRHAVAHRFVPGRPLYPDAAVDDDFFAVLHATLIELHQRGIAYVDLHKLENVLLGDDGRPHLIDFQISMRLPRLWPFSWVQKILQQSDLYHWQKHYARLRGDQCELSNRDIDRLRPWWIRAHRKVAVPVRQARRRLLVLLGIRKGSGYAQTEACPEAAFRLRPERDSCTP